MFCIIFHRSYPIRKDFSLIQQYILSAIGRDVKILIFSRSPSIIYSLSEFALSPDDGAELC
jgi:hypothetical protein